MRGTACRGGRAVTGVMEPHLRIGLRPPRVSRNSAALERAERDGEWSRRCSPEREATAELIRGRFSTEFRCVQRRPEFLRNSARNMPTTRPAAPASMVLHVPA